MPIHLLSNLQQELAALLQAKVLDNNLIQKYLNQFQYDYSALLPSARSIIVIAVPQPLTALNLIWREAEHTIIIPPTYVYGEAEKLVFQIAESELKKESFSLARANLPLKLLAVKSGLSQYGRNNITYIAGMGSYYRLIALISDMPSDAAAWRGVQRMPACDTCSACLNNCPTKCIDIKRNIIHASQCLTFLNEATEPFPDWVSSDWHNSIVGCMRCQMVCPQNRNYSIIKNLKEVLTEADINSLLYADNFTSLPKNTRALLEKINLNDYEITIIQRNLKALLLSAS
ncbi:4Fe-4S double cluster binding domain-containing protein [Sporomusa termitida]|uniref:4Fe-4S double cluster binding domain-containing protein n=1 Tax=Sporomusa termitida TaxID=2377 RepID=UPI001FEB5363|nr:4Fe-4S double cluster binding domain-containing protein [Sporomusa termitida]